MGTTASSSFILMKPAQPLLEINAIKMGVLIKTSEAVIYKSLLVEALTMEDGITEVADGIMEVMDGIMEAMVGIMEVVDGIMVEVDGIMDPLVPLDPLDPPPLAMADL